MLNVPNRLSVLYEYKSGTVNGLNNKIIWLCEFMACLFRACVAITDYFAADKLHLNCSLIMCICKSVFIFFFLLFLLVHLCE